MVSWIIGSSAFAVALTLWFSARNRKLTFYLLWRYFSPRMNEHLRPLKNKIFTMADPLSGTVLEIGPGFGETLQFYVDAARIDSIILVEPNTFMHPSLLSASRAVGLSLDRVTLLNADAAALPLPAHSVDAVVCCLVLCSVARPAAAIAEIRRVLRPGGQLIWIEHVAANNGPAAAAQRLLMSIGLWKLCGDGCDLRRPTGRALRDAGPWAMWRSSAAAGPAPFVPIEYGVAVREPEATEASPLAPPLSPCCSKICGASP